MAIIWVDADATPKAVRDIICRASNRSQTETRFVANHRIPLPPSPYLFAHQVEPGFDVADNYIVQKISAADLLISQDIPLAAEAMEKGAAVINNHGERYSSETIRQRLNMRDFYETLRASGVQSGGPAAYSDKDKQAFANALDRWLAQNTPR